MKREPLTPECVLLLLRAYARAEAGHSIDWEDINEVWYAACEEYPEAAAEAERQARIDMVDGVEGLCPSEEEP